MKTILYCLFGIVPKSKLVLRRAGWLAFALLAAGFSCKTPTNPVAGATATGSTLPAAIAAANTNHAAALAAVEKRSAVAAASVVAAKDVNATQPAGQPTTFVDRELGVAASNLPAPDATAVAAANERKIATLSTNLAAMEKLYGAAQSEADGLRKAAAAAVTKAEQASAALATAERSYAATLERNRAENQAKIDEANRKAEEAIQQARDEQNKKMVHIFIGLGVICVLAAIGMVIATSGASVWRSSIAGVCGICCFGVARLISHPWFWPALGALAAVFVIGAGLVVWRERKSALKGATLEKLAPLIQKHMGTGDGQLAAEVGVVLDDVHKATLQVVRKTAAVRAAKAAVVAAKSA